MERDSKSLEEFLSSEIREELVAYGALREEAEKRFQKAEELIRKYGDGKVIGRVSRISVSKIGGGKFEVVFDIPPETYFSNPISVGDILAAVNLANLNIVLLEVEEVRRADVLSILPVRPHIPFVPREEPSGILTPAIVVAKPLLAMDENGKVRIPAEPLEPQSPLFKPKPEVIIRLLGLPETGIVLGCFVTAGGKPLPDTPVMFPLEALYQHVLIIGTTGSGKTTFLKNFIVSLLHHNNYHISPEMDPTLVVFDATGEYSQLILPKPKWISKFGVDLEEEEKIKNFLYNRVGSLKEISVILPVPKKIFEEIYEKAKKVVEDEMNRDELAREIGLLIGSRYFNERIGNIINALGGTVISRCIEVELANKGGTIIQEIKVMFEAKIREETITGKITLLPWALHFRHISREIRNLCPIFTSQARAFFNAVLNALSEILETKVSAMTLKAVINGLSNLMNKISEKTQVHRGTIQNIIRGLSMLNESDLFDVEKNGILIKEPDNYEELLVKNRGKLVVVDLQEVEKAEFIIVYRILSRIFYWKKTSYEKGKQTHPVVILIDEAHRYFPRAGFAGEKESIQMIESMLKLICRLGRMRGLGIIFATHSQDDVTPIIQQLTNTKIAFRTEENLLEKLGIPKEYRTLLTLAPDRMALIKSHVFRTHMVFVKTCLPLAGHYDLSALALSK